ncbi:DUF2796 domain-containing protein [Allohahella sp. A8]|uniref:DUF2796 domain-containing protein n=1 Tax=Allohahella sp. A8 TaxID=3141461 RepID=UPI003A802880
MFKQNRLKSALSVALASASLILAAPAMAESKHHDDEHRQHGKHEHGAASMNIALDGKQLIVELDSPAMNILGFEHAADTPEDKAVAADMWKRLQHPNGVVSLDGGDCTVAESKVEMPQFDEADPEEQHALLDSDHKSDKELKHEAKHKDEHHGDDEHHADHHEKKHKADTHSDIKANYAFECANPEALESIQVKVFDTFPNFEAVETQWIINGRQGSKHLKAGESTIAVK